LITVKSEKHPREAVPLADADAAVPDDEDEGVVDEAEELKTENL
jgi:hypothetical protein